MALWVMLFNVAALQWGSVGRELLFYCILLLYLILFYVRRVFPDPSSHTSHHEFGLFVRCALASQGFLGP